MRELNEAVSLYESAPELYDASFGADDPEESAFFIHLISNSPSRRVLSLGCGTGRLEAALSSAGFAVTGLDASEAMLSRARERDPQGVYIHARMEDLADSLRDERFGAVISSTLSFAYLAERSVARDVITTCAHALMPGGVLALDLPIAHEPRRLQGSTESTEPAPGHRYQFSWYDEVESDDERSLLDSEIRIESPTKSARRMAMLAVYRPEGIRHLLQSRGLFENVVFFAPHDLSSETVIPPIDCRRAIVVAQRTS